jgi:hypothetical protein
MVSWGRPGTYYDHGYGLVIQSNEIFYCVGASWRSDSDDSQDIVLVRFEPPTETFIPGFELVFIIISLGALTLLLLPKRYFKKLWTI